MEAYLDNSATTRQHDIVTAEMLQMMENEYGNPSSLHRLGLTAEKRVKKARNLNIEMIFAEHIEKCATCVWRFECPLLALAKKYT